MKTKIGLVSDTHVPTAIPELPSRLLDELRSVDLILHAGDLVSTAVLEALGRIADTVAVHGNADGPEVAEWLPRKQIVEAAGTTIGLIHGDDPHVGEANYVRPDRDQDAFCEYLLSELPEGEVVVFGHFHVPVTWCWGDRLLVSPGSVAPYRGRSTFALLEVGSTRPHVEIVDLG